MNLEKDQLETLAKEYDFDLNELMEYYDEISKIPCVVNGDDELLLRCLETIVSGLKTNDQEIEFQKLQPGNRENDKPFIDTDKLVSKEYIISDALYRTYDDEAIPFLSDEYAELKGISKESYNDSDNFDFKI